MYIHSCRHIIIRGKEQVAVLHLWRRRRRMDITSGTRPTTRSSALAKPSLGSRLARQPGSEPAVWQVRRPGQAICILEQ